MEMQSVIAQKKSLFRIEQSGRIKDKLIYLFLKACHYFTSQNYSTCTLLDIGSQTFAIQKVIFSSNNIIFVQGIYKRCELFQFISLLCVVVGPHSHMFI